MQVLELTKAGSSIEFEIFAKKEKIGTITVGQGSLTWRGGKKQHSKRFSWSKFAELMDEHSYR